MGFLKNHILKVSLFLGVFACILDFRYQLEFASTAFYIAVVSLGLWITERRYIYISAFVCSCLILSGYFFSYFAEVKWLNIFNRFVALFFVWITAFICLLQKPVFFKELTSQLKSTRIYFNGVLISIVLFALSGFIIWNLGLDFTKTNNKNVTLQKLSGKIIHLDEVLTMSARMGAATADNQWEERYLKYEKQLDDTLNQTINLVPKLVIKEKLKSVQMANNELVRIEKQAFQLIRNDLAKQASENLFSKEYAELKVIYDKNIKDFLSIINIHLNKEAIKLNNRIMKILLIFGLIFLSVWIIILAWVRKNQKQLHESEEKYLKLFSSEPDAVAIFDAHTKLFLEINDSAVQLFGYSREEILKLKLADVYLNPELAETDFYNISSGKIHEVPLRFIKSKTDKEYKAELSAGNFQQGSQKQVFIIFKDISARVDAIKIIESMSKFPSEDPSPIFRVEPDGTLLYANSSAKTLLRSFNCETGDKIPKTFQENVTISFSSNSQITFEDNFNEKVYLLDVVPVQDEKYINIYGREITQLKKAELALLESRRYLQAIVSNAMDGIITISVDGTIKSVNPAAEEIFGYSAFELIGSSVSMLMPEPHRSEHGKYIQKFLDTGRPKVIGISREVPGLHRDNTIFPLEISVSEVKSENDQFFMGIVRDISVRKAAEEELEKFIYTASHDLQEPIRKIILFGDRLYDSCFDKLEENNREFIIKMMKASLRMKDLIEDLLGYSQLKHKKAKVEPIKLNLIIEEVLEDLDVQLELAEAIISPYNLPTVYGDKILIRQVFQNLISNSLKYKKPETNAHIQIDHFISKNNDHVLKLKDNGIGFEMKYKDQIFQPFTRLHANKEISGTGMGLFICKKIIQSHNGSISVESSPNKGTIFTITFPNILN